MILNIHANIGFTGLTDVGYQFIDSAGALLGSRVTSGVVEFPGGHGVYFVDAPTVPANAVGVTWDSAGTAAAKAIDVFDLIATDINMIQAVRVILAATAGASSGGNTDSAVFKDPDGIETVLTFTVDPVGNRSSVTINA